jgi:phage regulator Rha-like protein
MCISIAVEMYPFPLTFCIILVQRFKEMREMQSSSNSNRDDRQKREQQREEKELAKFAQLYSFNTSSLAASSININITIVLVSPERCIE